MHRKVHLFDIDIPGKITFKVGSIRVKPSPGAKRYRRKARRSPEARRSTSLILVNEDAHYAPAKRSTRC
jgi:hypothetical protein